MGIHRLSPDEVARLSNPPNPAIAKLYELEVEEVHNRGGLALAVFRLHDGFLFDNPVMTTDAVAEELGLPPDKVRETLKNVLSAVDARWRETPEYQASGYPEIHRRKREGLPIWDLRWMGSGSVL